MTRDYAYSRNEPHTGLFHWYLERKAERTPDETALSYRPVGLVDASQRTVTWAELNRLAGSVATQLSDWGVGRGEFVATLFPPSPEFVATYLGAAKLGATLAPLDLRGTPSDHAHVLGHTDPAAFVGAAQYRDQNYRELLGSVDEFESIGHTRWLDDADYLDELPDPGEYEWSVLDQDGDFAEGDAVGCTDPDADLLVVFTSGTTGSPKGAVLTHRNVVFQGTAISATWEIDDADVGLVHLPTDHVGGSTELVGSTLVGGSEMVLLDAFDPGVALDRIEDHGITMVGNVPAMWGMLFTHPKAEETDFDSLRVAIVAGQAPSEHVLRGMADVADYPVTGWGLTETAGFVTLTDLADEFETLLETEGRPFEGFEVATVDDDGAFVDEGETGEVVVRGDGVMDRYLSSDDTVAAFVDEDQSWVRTGDMGFVDSDGRLRLRGRKSNMYISGGYNVYPEAIEDVLEDHPDVQAATVVGVADEEWGEVGHAFVLTTEDADLTESDLEEYSRERLADYERPARFTVTTDLPQTSLGKIDRQGIVDQYDLDAV